MCPDAAMTAPANLVNSNAVRAVRRRGNLNNGAYYGPRYVNANNAPSNANWNYGGALALIQSTAKPILTRTREALYTLLFRGSERIQNTIRLESVW